MADDKKRILIQLDSDAQPSVFDRVVAVDAGADDVFAYSQVKVSQVQNLVHGAIFTRGPKDLKQTAIFVGGSKVVDGEAILEAVTKSFLGPMQVSVMLDSNGANTTAAAAVVTAARHVDLASAKALVLGGTGPVGQRAALLLADEGATVRLASRSLKRATDVANAINDSVGGDRIEGVETLDDETLTTALQGVNVVIAAGAAGVQLLPARVREQAHSLAVVIDLNAVPPLGVEGIDFTDAGRELSGAKVYGAVGVGTTKMKVHKAAIRKLFESNDQVLNAAAIYAIAKAL